MIIINSKRPFGFTVYQIKRRKNGERTNQFRQHKILYRYRNIHSVIVGYYTVVYIVLILRYYVNNKECKFRKSEYHVSSFLSNCFCPEKCD